MALDLTTPECTLNARFLNASQLMFHADMISFFSAIPMDAILYMPHTQNIN